MTASVNTSGSQTCTISTEHTLATITTAGVFQLALDLNALADGTTPDILTVKLYTKCRSSDTERLSESWEFIGAQGKPNWRSNPELSPHHVKFTITQSAGTGRDVPWAVYQA